MVREFSVDQCKIVGRKLEGAATLQEITDEYTAR